MQQAEPKETNVPEISVTSLCPCNSGRTYQQCCQPRHDNRQAADTAEALMRSRYSAYVLELWRYLYNSWDPQTRPTRKALSKTESSAWQNLEIVSTRKGTAIDEDGMVEFKASWRDSSGNTQILHEQSRFRRIGGKWVYVDGDIFNT